MAGLVEVVHFQPGQAGSIPSSGFDLYLSIDDDTDHRLPESLHPRAYWAIDTHRDFPARFARSVACDTEFAAQRDGAERLRNAGIEFLVPQGVEHRQRGKSVDAEQSWRRILGLTRPERIASLDMRIYGHLTRRYLEALARERRDIAESGRLWSAVLAECTGDREALARSGSGRSSR